MTTAGAAVGFSPELSISVTGPEAEAFAPSDEVDFAQPVTMRLPSTQAATTVSNDFTTASPGEFRKLAFLYPEPASPETGPLS
jgi:hypothetical protein